MTGYEELEDGNVRLTMMRADFERLMMTLGFAAGSAVRKGEGAISLPEMLKLVNRLNKGNPNHRPYIVEEQNS